ncbi:MULTISPECIES: alpha/beta fold hydrolase [unclassified Paenibacillus]|uniref:alpha/beta hydrolase family protein n=1 Tax=unclassified Paenibacillus TaxID=185978 RepID=UPI002406FF17|nr:MULTISPECIES: alpha/beta fold hydrolase [unclassified Paenibacillus]MDF9844609.1 pimeloyl-ACP methyl ester carboxylesterase [Paenibacillus sp. PastF-2]MDF9851213.1 pimeloyl-ACP methyl ester carboxylesterase [Paenibacillus sp. PastM-2]MDF9857794.1 pimeloyl-ACP methyl ester carboxylesterase [Paenibacillus sp. PastF-1]MDH6483062.1 pimeloyl-ACP methyl ester carboxylesterase [Paenibacillus sp. PastH-2]MDH6510474.1 pimeloyl-ACP methyl ester carboxylesterase [Paenibacillus sp. PastM-3]
MERNIVIRYEQEELTASIHYPSREKGATGRCKDRVPLAVICHGFVGNRIGVDRIFVKAARELARDGYMVIRFDYAGCGESSGNYGSQDIESLIAQTRAVLDYGIGAADIDPQRVTLIGHSLGGAVALLTAVRDRRVKNLVLWAAVGYPFNDIVKIVGRDAYDRSVKEGAADYAGYSFTPVYFNSLAAFQPFQEAGKFSGDVLVIHGTSDDVIPVDYAFLYQKLFWTRPEGRCDKEIIFQADHTFSSGPAQEQVLKRTKEWMDQQEHLQQEWQNWMI